mgnify:CR=1 FL=1
MIDFSKTEEQELLIESIKELLEREMPAEKERECYRNGEFPWDAWKAMAEAASRAWACLKKWAAPTSTS